MAAFQQEVQNPSIYLERFDTHVWESSPVASGLRSSFQYTTRHATQGQGAIAIETEVLANPENLDDNTARVETRLAKPEDWTGYSFVTMDIYMAENPTGLAEAKLYLENSKGEKAETPLILGWQLFQWENRQMTFPLKGNTYLFAAIPDSILSDVAKVGVGITRFSDAGFDTPYTTLHFTIDNMRLDGKTLWDSFDPPGWDWSGDQPDMGITGAESYGDSPGSMITPRILRATPRMPPASIQPMRAVSAKVKVPVGETLFLLTVETRDGKQIAVSETPFAKDAEGWETIFWPLDTPILPQEIVQLTFQKVGKEIAYLDDLEMISDPSLPFEVSLAPTGKQTLVQWRNPLQMGGDTMQVWARPEVSDETNLSCTVSAKTERGQCLAQTSEPNHDFVLTSAGGSVYAALPGRTLRFAPDGADYEAGFSAQNGALRYIQNMLTGGVVSTGNRGETLWTVTFLDEGELIGLRSDQFSPDSKTHRFRMDTRTFQLFYNYVEGERSFQMVIDVIPVDDLRFDLRARIINTTGLAIRTVTLPQQLTFDHEGLQRALFPIQEGMVLLPQFYKDQRSSIIARPPMFADVLAYEGRQGHLAVHMIQDSTYQADLLPHHPSGQPVFQPNNLGTGGIGDKGYFQLEMVTHIPDGGTWASGTVRISIDHDFRQIAADYRKDNGIGNYRTLMEKLGSKEKFDILAKSSILAVEMYKAIDWLKTPLGQSWSTIKETWLPDLPEAGVLHLTHWQKGRDWYDNPNENNKVEDNHPEALPIWWDRYGPEADFQDLMTTLADEDHLTMPFTNWTVWNTYDPATKDIPPLADTPAAALKPRGATYPFLEYKGYMVKPWSDDVSDRNTKMFDTYSTRFPQDLMFVDMTAERSWRYVLMEDGKSISAAAYTQGVMNENDRLSQLKPLFTEGVFDRGGSALTGYAQTLRQKFWNQILAHLGEEYEDWVAYPFAADVLHDKVAFYQHDLNSEVWPAEELSYATYYALLGYNYMIDVTKHIFEDEEQIWALDAIQKSVNARSFGQKLLDVEMLSPDFAHQKTTWGPRQNPMEVIANFDVDGTSETFAVDGHDIAPDGFMARTADGMMVAGVFMGRFGGSPLSPGLHWITQERTPDTITLRHPIGEATTVRLPRPADWQGTEEIALTYVLDDKSRITAPPGSLLVGTDYLDVAMPVTFSDRTIRSAEVTVDLDMISALPSASVPEPIAPPVELVPSEVEPASPAVWSLTQDNLPAWQSENANWAITAQGFGIGQTSATGTIGKSASPLLSIDLAKSGLLQLEITEISPSARLVVQVQEMAGDYRSFVAPAITETGPHSIDLAALIGDNVLTSYALVLWLEGPQARFALRQLELVTSDGLATAPSTGEPQDMTGAPGMVPDAMITPQDWTTENLTHQADGAVQRLTVADPELGYGKFTSGVVMIDPNTNPNLLVDIASLDASTAVSIQLLQEFDSYSSLSLATDLATAGPWQQDFKEKLFKSGPQPYRVVVKVSGSGSLMLKTVLLRN